MYEVGTRVLAVESADADEVRAFGYGIYAGDEVPELGVESMLGVVDEELHFLYTAMGGNPKIVLDSGDVVWGFQCWWGPQEDMLDFVGERPITIVPVPEGNEYVAR